MKKLVILLMTAFILTVGLNAHAILMPPAGFGADDKSILFTPTSSLISIEVYDLGNSLTNTHFGFYFDGSPSNKVQIFGPEDETSIPGDIQIALIDFNNHFVFDVDDGNFQVPTFPASSQPIGFYINIGTISLYTDPVLNPGGVDFAATFPLLGNPQTYFVGYEVDSIPVAFEITSGITQAVPEPATLILTGSGLVALAFYRKRKKIS
jgi:hypothetical protein